MQTSLVPSDKKKKNLLRAEGEGEESETNAGG
jgi:hypothetical protein